jgi:DNA-binding winged helix-turn-helix (wHTH) protein/TolB-like protein/tetratricopeptide (TPR) repeat protein
VIPELPPGAVVRFGAFELVAADQELRKRGAVVRVPTQPLRLLALLSARSGAIVTRAEIQRCLWPDGTVVDFDQSINHCVRQLRTVLDDSVTAPRWIETLPGRGYRFVAPATVTAPAVEAEARAEGAAVEAPAREASPIEGAPVAVAPVEPPAREASPTEPPPSEASPLPPVDPPPLDPPLLDPPPRALAAPRPRRSLVPYAAATAVAALVAALVLIALGRRAPPAPRPAPSTAPSIRLAVLPFAPLDPAAAPAATAITAELIAQLGERYAPRLLVIAHPTSARLAGSTVPVTDLGRSLDVAYLVDGTVTDGAGRRRIAARLVRVADAAQLWARTYDRDLAADGDPTIDVAVDVATALAVAMAPATATPPIAREAVDDYQQGLYHLRSRPWPRPREAAAALERAVARDPTYARAWAALAEARAQLTLPDGWGPTRAALAEAFARDPDLADAHVTAGLVALYADWDLARAIEHERAALAANPAHAEALHQLASAYAAQGRHRDALATIRAAAALDPQGTAVLGDVGWLHYLARDYPSAERECRRTLAFEPTYYWSHRCILLARLAAGDRAGAAAYARERLGDGATDDDPLAAWLRRDLARGQANGSLSAPDRAVDLLLLGEREAALALLTEAAATRAGWLFPFLAVDPVFDGVRDDPRFAAVVAAVAAGGHR